MTAEFLTKMGPLLIVVVYAPTNQDSTEEKDSFYKDLDCVITRGNGLAIVMGDFNASISERMSKVVGPHGLSKSTSDNGERLVSFARTYGLCITNTFFQHKRIHQASWQPPNPGAQASLKDYVLVKQQLRPSVWDTRVFRGGDMSSDHRLVVTTMKLRLPKKRPKERSRENYNAELLQLGERRREFAEQVENAFKSRTKQGTVEERWQEMKKVLEAATTHLNQKRKKKKSTGYLRRP